MKNIRQNYGITLIALIITIIIMLILVAVTVSVAFGENGLITRAMKAGKSWKDEEFREQVEMDLAAVIADLSAEGKTANTITDDLIKKLEDIGYDVTDNGDGTITVEKDDKTAIIDEDLNVTIGGEVTGNKDKAPPTIGLTLVEDATVITTATSSNIGSVNDNVPIPTGFTYFTGTKDAGLVVKDASLNEFVWVPVKMYEGIQVNITHKNSGEKVRKYAEGNQPVEYFETQGTVFTGNSITIPEDQRAKTTTYTIYAESKNGEKATKQVTIDGMYWENGTQKVGQLYYFWDNGSGGVSIYKYGAGEYQPREPDTVLGNGTEYDAVAANRINAGFAGTAEEFKDQMQDDFDEMIRSVQKCKGFYIGRYETAGLNGTVVVKSGQGSTGTDLDPSINQDWYVSYKKQREFKQVGSVRSNMIWGCQWAQVMLWMKDIKNTTDSSKYYIIDSSRNG